MSTRHPDQPIETTAEGHRYFKRNKIVCDLLEVARKHGFTLNEIALGEYSDEDRVQLAQLIGYSVSGFGELSYVSDETYARATGET